MKDSYITVAKEHIFKQVIDRSVFIGHVKKTESEEEAREFIKEIKNKYSDATHNCSAYVQGMGGEHEFADDNGEPGGSAGKPILGVLRSKGLTNVTLVVTRYFRGKKLGVRGLIDAYGSTARLCLEEAGIKEEIVKEVIRIKCSYKDINRILYIIEKGQGEVVEKDYAQEILLAISIRLRDKDTLKDMLAGFAEILF